MTEMQVPMTVLVPYLKTFASLINAGLSLVRSLAVLGELTDDATLRAANAALQTEIEAGATLSAAMLNQPTVYSRFLVTQVRAGELGGVLQTTLGRAAAHYELVLQWRDRLRTPPEPLARKMALHHFCDAFGTLLGSGVPLLQAIPVAGELLPEGMAGWAEATVAALRDGAKTLAPLMEEWGFPAAVVQLTALGEETGRLDQTMVTAGEVLGFAVEAAVRQ